MLLRLRLWLRQRDNQVLLAALLIGLVSHAWGLFRYPLYLTDEGVYVQRAWSTVEHTELSPYTYTYDHAPGGWLVLAAWNAILPDQFNAFGNPIDTGRALMLLVHLASVYLLFQVARRFSGGLVAPFVATLLFNLSPLAVFYQRMVLLDNIMVFWLLLSLYLLSRVDQRITAALAAGAAFGMAMVTKENAVFFVPVLAFLLYQQLKGSMNRRFSRGFYYFAAGTPVSFYLMYAALKGELLPTGLNFSLSTPPTGHVSLAYTIWWQLNRTGGSAVSGKGGLFWGMMHAFWLPKDHILLVAGGIATVVLLFQGIRDRHRNQPQLAAALLAVCYAIYLMRGSVLLDFYIIPLVPLLALNLGLVVDQVLRRLPQAPKALGVSALVVALAIPVGGGYLLTHGPTGRLQAPDMYRLDLTGMQTQQLNWVEAHVPHDSKVIIDDDMWTTLHNADPPYRYAISHWQASADPAVRDKVFHNSWHNIDYIVMSNKMRLAMVRNNSDGRETWILDALDNHSRTVWHLKEGDVALSVHQVDH